MYIYTNIYNGGPLDKRGFVKNGRGCEDGIHGYPLNDPWISIDYPWTSMDYPWILMDYP